MADGGSVDALVIQRTQETLGKIIKKPPLTEKLLRKPPFKFLHDIMTVVINTTGFMKGVFTDEELNSENIKDRDSKIAFLQKAVDYVGNVLGESVKIRLSKTVAGHEAERTNEFLQALAAAILKQSAASPKKDVVNSSTEVGKRDGSSSKKIKKGKTNELLKQDNIEVEHKNSESLKISSHKGLSEKKKSEKRDKVENKLSSERSKKKRVVSDDGVEKSSREKERHSTKDRSRSRENEIEVKHRSESKDKRGEKSRSKPYSRHAENKDTRKVTKEAGSSKEHRSRKETSSVKVSKRSSSKMSSERKPLEKILAEVENGDTVEETSAVLERKESTDVDQDKPSISGSTTLTNGEALGEVTTVLQSGRTESSRLTSGRPPTGRRLSASTKLTQPNTTNDTSNVIENGAMDSAANADDNNNLQSDMQNGFLEEEPVKRPSTSTIRRSSARPPTARPAAPRIRVVEMAPEDSSLSQTVKQVSNIIMDDDQSVDVEEDEAFVIEEAGVLLETDEVPIDNLSVTAVKQDGKEHGSLVTQILETKKDLDGGSERLRSGSSKRVEVETHLSDSARKKEREMLLREVERLREGVQTLTRNANPLGKLIDYLQEDVDSMLRELDRWMMESRQHELALQKEQSKSDAVLDDLNEQMQGVEDAIEDMANKILMVKASIVQNEDKIQKLVAQSKM